MPSKVKDRVYWDSCVFIDLLQSSPGRIDVLREYATKAEAGEIEFVTSSLSLAEVAKLPELGLSDELVEQKIIDFFENPYILLRSVDRRVLVKAREFVRIGGIAGADAIHLATAVQVGVSVFHTYDDRFIRKCAVLTAGNHILAKDGTPLKVIEPEDIRPPIIIAAGVEPD